MRHTHSLTAILAVLISLAALAATPAAAPAAAEPARPAAALQTATLFPARDNTLYESANGGLSNGAGQHFFAGTTNNGDVRRGLLAFDMAGVPPGATVVSATLTLRMSRAISGETPVSIHAVTADWGEGLSDAQGEEGAGAVALPNDATWLHTFFHTETWVAPGGDFNPAPLAATVVGAPGVYTWSSPALVADVTRWLADPDANFGWLVHGDESASGTAKRFDSRENPDPDARPRLIVTYLVEAARAYIPVVQR